MKKSCSQFKWEKIELLVHKEKKQMIVEWQYFASKKVCRVVIVVIVSVAPV
jgi:hypothetical protein